MGGCAGGYAFRSAPHLAARGGPLEARLADRVGDLEAVGIVVALATEPLRLAMLGVLAPGAQVLVRFELDDAAALAVLAYGTAQPDIPQGVVTSGLIGPREPACST